MKDAAHACRPIGDARCLPPQGRRQRRRPSPSTEQKKTRELLARCLLPTVTGKARIRCVSLQPRPLPDDGLIARPWAPQFVPPAPSTTGCSVGGPTSKSFAMRSSRFDLPQPFQARSRFASRRVDTFVAVATCRRSGFEAEVSPL